MEVGLGGGGPFPSVVDERRTVVGGGNCKLASPASIVPCDDDVFQRRSRGSVERCRRCLLKMSPLFSHKPPIRRRQSNTKQKN